MAKHLTDKQKKKIIADYVECGNYSEVARNHKISASGVKKIVIADSNSMKKFEQKKEENTKDMIEYLDSKKLKAFDFIDKALDGMIDDEKIKKTSVSQLATAMGIVIDKYVNIKDVDQDKEKVIIKGVIDYGDKS